MKKFTRDFENNGQGDRGRRTGMLFTKANDQDYDDPYVYNNLDPKHIKVKKFIQR